MRKMKKLASMMLALVMVLAMSVTAFAEDEATDPTEDETTRYTITINNSTNGYEYTAYQIFEGDLLVTTTTDEDTGTNTTTTTLSNIEFGTALSETDQATVLAKYEVSSAAKLAEALADNTIDVEDFAAYIADTFTLTSAGTSTYNTSNYTISVTGAGYYLIKNTDVPDKDGAYTSYILEVVRDVSVDAKSDIPSLDKTVGDVNDSDNSTAQGDTDSADYDIGDAVPFTLTATLPTNYGDYETYKLIFHDTMSAGLTFNSNSVKVTIDGTEVDSTNYTVSQAVKYVVDEETGEATNVVESTEITITFSDLTSTAATAGSKVVVTYTATLNSNASYKEGNDAYLEYSNNPNEESGGTTGETPDDKTTVFTFSLTVNKKDENNGDLSGAGFTLYKYDADATYTYEDEDGNEKTGTGTYVAVGEEITGENLTSFTWSGLDDGQYKLVETTTPAGYNTMEDVVFYIVAEHTENGLTSLKVTSDAAGTTEITGYTENLNNGTITADIVNYSGSTLPSTGGIGTTIFYVVGTILVLGAAVLLITRRRMSKAE